MKNSHFVAVKFGWLEKARFTVGNAECCSKARADRSPSISKDYVRVDMLSESQDDQKNNFSYRIYSLLDFAQYALPENHERSIGMVYCWNRLGY